MSIGFVYDDRYLDHDTGMHPERPERLTAITNALSTHGLTDHLRQLPPRPAAEDEILAVHERGLIEGLRAFCSRGGGILSMDTVVSPMSFDVAMLAAGGAIVATDYALGGSGPAVAAIRPPGHHATAGTAMGFCLFNNAAVAASYARRSGADRVFILDWDLHHGNGTEAIFLDDPSVLYCSIHQYPAYPGTGAVRDTGRGDGTGYTVNIPVPGGSGDCALTAAMDEVVIPVMLAYKPDIVICSAGYDGHFRDPLGGLTYTLGGFDRMAESLYDAVNACCPGRIVVLLEGGYDLSAVGTGTAVVTSRLLGRVPDLQPEQTAEAPQSLWGPAVNRAREQASLSFRLARGKCSH